MGLITAEHIVFMIACIDIYIVYIYINIYILLYILYMYIIIICYIILYYIIYVYVNAIEKISANVSRKDFQY